MPAPPSPQPRQLRVFVSSTFRDMQTERDMLVKFIFPQLRKLCERRRVTWGEVDLRWGITDEQKSEGGVLPICLGEIQRCRPYFIGLLGERYGWVTDEIPPELIEREPWLSEHAGSSVTELEILHGVLRDPAMAEHAFFFFRDPDYLNRLPPGQHSDFREGPSPQETGKFGEQEARRRAEGRHLKLLDLKQRIRSSGLPVHENYRDPQELGQLVLQALTEVINQLYPEGSQPDPLDRLAAEHESFALSRSQIYIGRRDYFDRLDAHARSNEPPLVILGESGSGKSALLANWGLKYRREHPNELVVMHFVGASPDSSDWAAILGRVMAELQRRFGLPGEIPADPDQLRAAFPNWLAMAAAKGRTILILDALNQLEQRGGALELAWLPARFPDGVQLVVSTLPGRPRQVLQARKWPELTVQQLEPAERAQLVRDTLQQYSKQLSSGQVERIVSDPLSANPLGLRTLLDELRLFGVHERLDQVIDAYLKTGSLPERFALFLDRCEQDYDQDRPGLVREAMSLLWASRRGLSESELLQLLGNSGQPLPQRAWSPLHLALEQSLIDRAGLLGFFHEHLRRAVEQRYLPTPETRQAAHTRLADHFAVLPEHTPRQVDELPWQLMQAEDWPRLYKLLADTDMFQKLWELNRSDLETYWAAVESHTRLTRLEAYRPVTENPDGFPNNVINWLALLFDNAGLMKEAMALHQAYERIARRDGKTDDLHRALGNQAAILFEWGRLDEAMLLYKEQERLCRQAGNDYSLSISLGNQARLLSNRGHTKEALELHKEEQRLCRQLGDMDGLQRSFVNQAYAMRSLGRRKEAMALAQEAEHLCRQLGSLAGLHHALGIQAEILRDWKRQSESLVLVRECQRLCRQLGDPGGLQAALVDEGNIFLDWGRLDEALALFQEAEQLNRQLGNNFGIAACLINQGLVHGRQGNVAAGLKLGQEALALAERIGYADLAALIRKLIIRIRLGKFG